MRATIDRQAEQSLGRGDVLAVPLWHGHGLRGVEDATLLLVTDEPIMAKFGGLTNNELSGRRRGSGRLTKDTYAEGLHRRGIGVTAPTLFETYRPLTASIAAPGGRCAVRGGDFKVLEGYGPPPRSVLLDSAVQIGAMEWYNSTQ